MSEPRKYAPSEPVALEPRAFGMFLFAPYQPTIVDRGGVTVLSVRGPMQQFRDVFCESYEFVVERVRGALASSPRAIVLSISSPGGLVSGVFEAADSIRAMCAAAGVPLYAYVDGAACSAAYALACAASHISAPVTASVGSIGVIAECVDASAQLAQMGVRVDLVTSGGSKGDGDPRVRSDAPVLARIQAKVGELAEVFFAYVAQHRPISVDAVRALDAGVFLGAKARQLGLVDEVRPLEELLAAISASPAQTTKGSNMSKGYEDAVAALRKAAASDDEKEAAKAKRMLAAELAEDDPPSDEPEPKNDDEEEAKAEGDEPEPKNDDEEEAKATAAAAPPSAEQRLASLEAHARTELLASRPDIAPALRAEIAKLPLEQARAFVAATPKPVAPKPTASAAATTPAPTRGAGQGSGASIAATPELAALNRIMGGGPPPDPIRIEKHSITFGVMTREQAAARVAQSKGESR